MRKLIIDLEDEGLLVSVLRILNSAEPSPHVSEIEGSDGDVYIRACLNASQHKRIVRDLRDSVEVSQQTLWAVLEASEALSMPALGRAIEKLIEIARLVRSSGRPGVGPMVTEGLDLVALGAVAKKLKNIRGSFWTRSAQAIKCAERFSPRSHVIVLNQSDYKTFQATAEPDRPSVAGYRSEELQWASGGEGHQPIVAEIPGSVKYLGVPLCEPDLKRLRKAAKQIGKVLERFDSEDKSY